MEENNCVISQKIDVEKKQNRIPTPKSNEEVISQNMELRDKEQDRIPTPNGNILSISTQYPDEPCSKALQLILLICMPLDGNLDSLPLQGDAP